jgi:uncharacterized protein YndB with AHSA1/START domain
MRQVFRALTTQEGFTGWWSSGASGDVIEANRIDLSFQGLTTLRLLVRSFEEDRMVYLECLDGPEGWPASTLRFELGQGANEVFVTLTHDHLNPEQADTIQYFVTKWPMFLVSLKQFVETGMGRPYPNDIRIQSDA